MLFGKVFLTIYVILFRETFDVNLRVMKYKKQVSQLINGRSLKILAMLDIS